MCHKKLSLWVLCAALVLSAAGCGKTQTKSNAVDTSETTELQPPETVGYGAPDQITGIVIPEFDEETAQRLGRIYSDIYGELLLYYQNDKHQDDQEDQDGDSQIGYIMIFNADKDHLFTLDANGYYPYYQDTPIELHGEDVNFDGHTDFYLLQNRTSQGDYCFFWLWNANARTYEYYVTLSSTVNPVIDAQNKCIVSTQALNADQLRRTIYRWQNGNLTAVSDEKISAHPQQEPEEEDLLPGMKPEIADTNVLIQDGHILSSVVFNVNENTHSRWICTIEDTNIVSLYSDELNNENLTHLFTFKGVSPGVTTVVFRYSTGWDDTFVTQKILTVRVGNDRLISIVAED